MLTLDADNFVGRVKACLKKDFLQSVEAPIQACGKYLFALSFRNTCFATLQRLVVSTAVYGRFYGWQYVGDWVEWN
jgi:hypothetical protein